VRRTVLAVVGVMILTGSPARAHHGYANFFRDRAVTIEGEIVEAVRFVDPHVVLKVRTADSTVYTATWLGASAFRHGAGVVTSTTLKVHDHIVVIGCPPRDPASQELYPLKELRRPSDGWIWQEPTWARTHPS
jgi:hypothetical protein